MIDTKVLKAALKKLDDKQRCILSQIINRSGWKKASMFKVGHAEDDECEHCGRRGADWIHLLWECPCSEFTLLRNKYMGVETLCKETIEGIPRSILTGMPPPISKLL